MARHKGSSKLERQWLPWGPDHPVMRNIISGTRWFDAWVAQACTPFATITRKTGIGGNRLDALHFGAFPTAGEIEALARLWNCQVNDVIASITLERPKFIDDDACADQPAGMCNLYHLKQSRAEIVGMFDAADHWQADLAKDYIAPGRDGPVVIERDGQRISGLMAWGVPNNGKLVTNVRNLESPFWRSMLAAPHHRCLVPVAEFEEWSAKPDPATGKKRAHWFSIPSRPLFAFAGIWRKVDSEPRFAFLTTEPNPLVASVHPKAMPVILDEEHYAPWLTAEWADAALLVTAYPSQLMAMTD